MCSKPDSMRNGMQATIFGQSFNNKSVCTMHFAHKHAYIAHRPNLKTNRKHLFIFFIVAGWKTLFSNFLALKRIASEYIFYDNIQHSSFFMYKMYLWNETIHKNRENFVLEKNSSYFRQPIWIRGNASSFYFKFHFELFLFFWVSIRSFTLNWMNAHHRRRTLDNWLFQSDFSELNFLPNNLFNIHNIFLFVEPTTKVEGEGKIHPKLTHLWKRFSKNSFPKARAHLKSKLQTNI